MFFWTPPKNLSPQKKIHILTKYFLAPLQKKFSTAIIKKILIKKDQIVLLYMLADWLYPVADWLYPVADWPNLRMDQVSPFCPYIFLFISSSFF